MKTIGVNWLANKLGFVTAAERRGIRLGDAPAWEITAPQNSAAFLRALSILVPPTAVLYLEGGSPSPEIREYLATRAPARTTDVEMGTIWPRPTVFHMSVTPPNLEGLAEFAERCAFPELAIHLHVYNNENVLLQWYDAGCHIPLQVSKQVAIDKISTFCNQLGVSYKDAD